MIHDLVIRRGTIVTSGDHFVADLAIRNGVISAIGTNLEGMQILDAGGKLVLPGAVDPHVHLEMPIGQTASSDDWHSGTLAAAYGGTTTVIDFVEPEPGEALLQALKSRIRQASGRANIDYGLHMTITSAEKAILDQIPFVAQAGSTSFKLYTTYEGFRLEDGELLIAMEEIGRIGALAIVHAENSAIINYSTEHSLDAGKGRPQSHAMSHPRAAETEAIRRVLTLADIVGTPIYIVHISSREGARILAEAKERGQACFGETCPQYLLLTEEKYDLPGLEGAKFVCSPPLRTRDDNEALWGAITRGVIDTIGTDHCPFFFRGQKDLGRDDFTKIPGGLPGIELRLPLIYCFGVYSGQLTLERWIDVCCTSPAKLFGLYPKKGTLIPGADADIVVFDPERRVEITKDMLHENVDYSPYEGCILQGFPDTVIIAGRILIDRGEQVGPGGMGRFIARKLPALKGGSS